MNNHLIEKIKVYLNHVFASDQKRINHIFKVRDMALKLGKKYDVDLTRLEIASLLHDITKNDSKKETYDLARQVFSEKDLSTVPQACLHAYSARVKAEKMFGISDQAILDAITYHCSGRIFKYKIEQIIYISDYIEESRDFIEDSFRLVAFKNLDLATYNIFNKTINYLSKHNKLISDLSKEALVYYKNKSGVINER